MLSGCVRRSVANVGHCTLRHLFEIGLKHLHLGTARAEKNQLDNMDFL